MQRGYAVRYRTIHDGQVWYRYTQNRQDSKACMADYEAVQDASKSQPEVTYWNVDWCAGPELTPAQVNALCIDTDAYYARWGTE